MRPRQKIWPRVVTGTILARSSYGCEVLWPIHPYMDSDQNACPDCHTALARVTGRGGLRFSCPSCGGFAVGVAVLRRELAEGVESGIWMASADAADDGPPCPFCLRRLREVRLTSSSAGVCRTCEMLWLSKEAAAQLPAAAAPKATAASLVPDRCSNCGAAYTDTPDGSCRFCHHSVVAPQLVVIAGTGGTEGSSRDGPTGGVSALLDALLHSL